MNEPATWLVLDVDDTLIDTVTIGFAKVSTVATRLGLPGLDQDDFDAAYARVPFEQCVRLWFPGAEVELFQKHYDRLAAEIAYPTLLDLPELLDACAVAGLRVAVLTNGPRDKITRKLAALQVAPERFEVVLCGDDGHPRKPHPAAFERLREYGIDPTRCWYVSDDRGDWEAAAAAGMRTLAVINGRRRQHRTLDSRPVYPDAVVTNSADLHRVVVSLRAELDQPVLREQPRAVLFDAGFTLISDRRTPGQLVTDELGRRHQVVTTEQVSAAMAAQRHHLTPLIWQSTDSCQRGLNTFYQAVFAALGVEDASSSREVLNRYVDPANWTARAGTDTVLAQLSRLGLSAAVYSNWQHSLAETIDAAGLGGYFSQCLASVDLGAAKPAREGFHTAVCSIGATPASTVYVGDDPAADFAALGAGLRPVLIDTRASDGSRLAAALSAVLDSALS